MHIHYLQVVPARGLRANKDTNGGYGTVNDYGSGWAARFLKLFKSSTMNFPELLPAYVLALLKHQGHTATYAQNQVDPQADLVLIQTSIINFQPELDWAGRIRQQYPRMKIGFIGGMVTGNPDLYAGHGDFSIVGEVENALLHGDPASFEGRVDGGLVENLDALPFPDWSHLRSRGGGYGLLNLRRGRFLPMLSSRGCPMSCRFYCTYPLTQGTRQRTRSPENVVDEIAYLQRQFGMTTIMFRDPIFSLRIPRVQTLCELILQRGLKFNWICETHPRYLTPDLIALMARAGCSVVKLGLESGNLEVMQQAQRAGPDLLKQEAVIRVLEKNGIRVFGFYMLGYLEDTEATIQQTIDYAIHLNTYGAQFAITTPFPGTPWYAELQEQPQVYQLDPILEHYNEYRLVYRHPHLSFETLEKLKSLAYRRYYFRPAYILKHYLRRPEPGAR